MAKIHTSIWLSKVHFSKMTLFVLGNCLLFGGILSEQTTTPSAISPCSSSSQSQGEGQRREDCITEETFVCRICRISFHGRTLLTHHITKHHPGEKPYWCDVCGKGFDRLPNLKTHTRIHTGHQPFSCELCDKSFNVVSNLKRHVLKNHKDHKELYSCTMCDSSFSTRLSLKRHMPSHYPQMPFTCRLCKKRFRDASELESHVKSHANDELYLCKLCGKKFRREYSLRCHMRAHLSEDSLICKHCGKKYKSIKNLEKHMTIVHMEENAIEDDVTLPTEYDDESGKNIQSNHQETPPDLELERTDEAGGTSNHTPETSLDPEISCSCSLDSDEGQENRCLVEQLLAPQEGAMAHDGDRVDEISDESSRMAMDPIYNTHPFNEEAGMIQDDNHRVEEFLGIDPDPPMLISEVPNHVDVPDQSFRIALDMIDQSPLPCNLRENEISAEIRRVVDEMFELYIPTQKSGHNRDGRNQQSE